MLFSPPKVISSLWISDNGNQIPTLSGAGAILTAGGLNANCLHVRVIANKVLKGNVPARALDERRRHFVSRCRARGVRVTTQRLAVFQALAEDATHPTADPLYAGLRKSMPSLSLSTVYRILESLEKEGLIRRVGATNGISRYDGNLLPHQHLVCRHCGGMTDLEDESLSRLRLSGVCYGGFVAEELDIRVLGTCVQCRRSVRRAAGLSPKVISGRQSVSRKKEEC